MLRPLKPAELKRATHPVRFHERAAALSGRLLPARLRTARGILLGLVISLGLWAVIAAALLHWLS